MTIILFILILALLVIVHEFGHFIVARKTGMRVDEFGLGLPPRAMTLFTKGETRYTLNWIPFGGFVKIHGEDMEVSDEDDISIDRAFGSFKASSQALVLVAGIVFNIVFAWLLFSAGFMFGMPSAVDGINPTHVEDAKIVITGVLPESPANEAGLKSGDTLLSLESGDSTLQVEAFNVLQVQEFIRGSEDELSMFVLRDGSEYEINLNAVEGVVEEGRAVGISLATLGILELPIHEALLEGARVTGVLLRGISIGIVDLVGDAIQGEADLSSIAGPVGIVGLVGDARTLGLVYLLSFTAFISLNLAILNLIPFPALDGGRLLFVLIEKIKGSPINPRVFQTVNGIGFLILILLMLVVTFNDITRLL